MGNERKNESSGLQISLFYKHKDSEELLYPEILKKYRKQKKVKHGPWWKLVLHYKLSLYSFIISDKNSILTSLG